jgi:glutathione peroxidase
VTDEPLDYVRQAALRLIVAARSALDLIEDLVSDPELVTRVVNQVGKLAETVIESAATARQPTPEPEAGRKVEHIPVRKGLRSLPGMTIYDVDIESLQGQPLTLSQYEGQAVLVVNVASKCGLTPQYTGLEHLQERYKDRGFTVLGVPCNQFGGQEPGSPQEIATFCSTTYAVTFPMTEKVEVNGTGRHPLYQQLTEKADAEGQAGDIQWNFEKFLISPVGEVVARFRPMTEPEAPEVTSAIEAVLPG